MRAERGACFVELQADANHFMLEPVEATDMNTERKKKEREKMINDAMGMSFFGPPAPRKKSKKYGRPNAKESEHFTLTTTDRTRQIFAGR